MPESSLWAIIVAFFMLAVGLTLKLTEYKRFLRDETKSLDAARSELASIKQDHDKAIIGIKDEYQHKIDELTKKLTGLKTKQKEPPLKITPPRYGF